MADNITVTPGSGATVAAANVAGVLFQKVKPTLGAGDTAVDQSVGPGASDGGTARFILSTDDPAVVQLTTIAAKGSAAGSGVTNANTARVTLATDDAAVTSLAALAARDKGAGATSANTARVVLATESLTALSQPALGRASAANSQPSVLSNEDYAALGSLTETAPATDTASSGLNGRLQRIAQRFTTLLTAFGTFGSVFAGRSVLHDVNGNVIDFTAKSPIYLTPTATANGLTKSRVNSAATTNATSLKASAGNIYEIRLFNVAAYDVFVKFYDKASAPTVGTDTPTWTIPLKAGTGFSDSYGNGDSFANGIAYAITKLQADSDTTAVAAGDVTGKIAWI
jgi:hypothetical protein